MTELPYKDESIQQTCSLPPPEVLDMPLVTNRCIKEPKKKRKEQQQLSAAATVLDEEAQKILADSQLQWIFEGLRAVTYIPFDFCSFLRTLWGHEELSKASKLCADLPSLDVLQKLKGLFADCGASVINPAKFLDLLLTLIECKQGSHWTCAVIIVNGRAEGLHLHYVGCDAPKMLFLMRLLPHAPINTWLVASTSYRDGGIVGVPFRALLRCLLLEIKPLLLRTLALSSSMGKSGSRSRSIFVPCKAALFVGCATMDFPNPVRGMIPILTPRERSTFCVKTKPMGLVFLLKVTWKFWWRCSVLFLPHGIVG